MGSVYEITTTILLLRRGTAMKRKAHIYANIETDTVALCGRIGDGEELSYAKNQDTVLGCDERWCAVCVKRMRNSQRKEKGNRQ